MSLSDLFTLILSHLEIINSVLLLGCLTFREICMVLQTHGASLKRTFKWRHCQILWVSNHLVSLKRLGSTHSAGSMKSAKTKFPSPFSHSPAQCQYPDNMSLFSYETNRRMYICTTQPLFSFLCLTTATQSTMGTVWGQKERRGPKLMAINPRQMSCLRCACSAHMHWGWKRKKKWNSLSLQFHSSILQIGKRTRRFLEQIRLKNSWHPVSLFWRKKSMKFKWALKKSWKKKHFSCGGPNQFCVTQNRVLPRRWGWIQHILYTEISSFLCPSKTGYIFVVLWRWQITFTEKSF